MGLLMLAGLIGTVVYGSHIIKNDIKAEQTDYRTKPTFDTNKNQKKIKDNFKDICRRSGIKTDRVGNPLNDTKIESAREYLRYQGYTENDIQFFTDLFNSKTQQGYDSRINVMKCKNERLKYKLQYTPSTEMVILRRTIYNSHLAPTARMEKLLENDLWSSIVDHYSYIKSGGNKWEEIWTLKVPKDFFTDIKKEELYKNVCMLQNVEYTI